MRALRIALRWATQALLLLGCVATFVMMAHVALDVASKLLLRKPLVGTLEMVTHYYMVAVVFLPLAMVQARRGQILVEVFTHWLSRRSLAGLDGVVAMLGAVFVGLLAWQSGVEALGQSLLREEALSSHFPVEIWPARWFVVLGAAVAALHLALQGASDLYFAATGERLDWEESPAAPSGEPGVVPYKDAA